jgi:hypothetical protein
VRVSCDRGAVNTIQLVVVSNSKKWSAVLFLRFLGHQKRPFVQANRGRPRLPVACPKIKCFAPLWDNYYHRKLERNGATCIFALPLLLSNSCFFAPLTVLSLLHFARKKHTVPTYRHISAIEKEGLRYVISRCVDCVMTRY